VKNSKYYDGIWIGYSRNNAVINNTLVNNNNHGIVLTFSNSTQVINNTVVYSRTYQGIALYTNSSYNLVYNNTVHSNNDNGIMLGLNTNHNEIISNTVYNNSNSGIRLYRAGSQNKIIFNKIYENINNGISADSSSGNIIIANTISRNQYGIVLSNSSNGNYIGLNNLIDNGQNAYDNGINNWNGSIFNLGNYWSDFDEPSEGAYDNNTDGIIDSPYSVPGDSNQDFYPLARPCNVSRKLTIGALLDLSGPLTQYGEGIKKALDFAVYDINRYLILHGSTYGIEIKYKDTQANSTLALQKIQEFYNEGVRLVIGPVSSGEFFNIIDYINSTGMIVASPSSTASSKYLGYSPEQRRFAFRFMTPDDFEAKVMARIANQLGKKTVIIIYPDGVWGESLNSSLYTELAVLGINVTNSYLFHWGTSNFSSYISSMESDVNGLLSTYNLSEIAVIAIGGSEISDLIDQIPLNSNLLQIDWVASDFTYWSIAPPCKANSIKLYSPVYNPTGPGYQAFVQRYETQYNSTPYVFALNAYDALWSLVLAYSEVGSYDANQISNKLPSVAYNYSVGNYGIDSLTGNITFDEYHDRISGNYSIYAVGGAQWVEVGRWVPGIDQLVLSPPPSYPMLTLPDVSIQLNRNVTVPVTLVNSTNVTGVNFTLIYNGSVVQIIGFEKPLPSQVYANIDNVNGIAYFAIVFNNTESGTFTIINLTIHAASPGYTDFTILGAEISDENFTPSFICGVSSSATVTIVRGDVNGDGTVNIADVTMVAWMVVGKVPSDLTADFNGNGRVDIGDLSKIAYYVLGKISVL
jgi:branched-chain amino acid transport system substrate-binding protein